MTQHVGIDAWRATVASELGEQPASSLVVRSVEGIAIEPLYGDSGTDRPALLRREPLRVGPVRSASELGSHGDEARLGAGCVWILGRPTTLPSGLLRVVELDDGEDAEGDVVLRSPLASQCSIASGNGAWARDRGATAAEALGIGLGALLRALRARPLDRTPTLALAVGAEMLVEIATLRAARRAAMRALAALSLPTDVRIVARTTSRVIAELDAPTNALRITLATSAGIIGGADAVAARSHELMPAPVADRLARNVGLLLVHESELAAVDDPAHGSGGIEAMTDAIAKSAWDVVRELERRGGLESAEARSWAQARIDASCAERVARVRTRKSPLVGVSRFPRARSLEPSLTIPTPELRDAAPWERLRARPSAPAMVAWLGPRRALEARADFAREALELAGLDVAVSAPSEDVEALVRACAEARPEVIAVCCEDTALGGAAVELVRRLSSETSARVLVAGRPKEHEPALRAAGMRDAIYVGCDLVRVLEEVRA